MKHLPRADFEEEGADRIQVRRVISRSHPIKTMFMGVVFKRQPEHDFDGKITMKRVSRTRQLERDTYRGNRFHHDHNINQLIVDGDRRNVYDDDTYKMLELTTMIAAHYELDDDIAEALCLRYTTHVGEEVNRRTVTLRDEETLQGKSITLQDRTQRPLTIDDLNLYCYYPQGSIIEEDITCNSNFMLQTMPAIGAEIRQKMPWIPPDQPIYLILDNAGGHGTRQAINEYTRQLRDQHNVILKYSATALSRIECPGSGHLDEPAVSCRTQTLEQEKRCRSFSKNSQGSI